MWLTDDSNVRAISRIPRLLRGGGAQSCQHARLPFFSPRSNVRQQSETGDGPQRLHEGLPLILELGCRGRRREATSIKIRLPSLSHCRRIFNTRAIPAFRSSTIPKFSAAIPGRSLLPLLVVSIIGAEDDSFTRSIESEQSL